MSLDSCSLSKVGAWTWGLTSVLGSSVLAGAFFGFGATVVTTNPLQAHIDLLDRITDKQIHDLVAYLENLK